VPFWKAEVAVVTFSVFDPAPVPKVLNPATGPSPQNFQIWESDSCSDSGYHRCNRNSAMFLFMIRHIWKPGRLLKMKSGSGSESRFSQILASAPVPGLKEKRRILLESTPALRIRGCNGAKC